MVIWYLRKNTIWKEAIAVVMAVNIVLLIMKKYLHKNEKPSSPNEEKKNVKEAAPATFFDVVYKLVRKIPKGRVTTYGAIAEAAGIRLSARMVGWAMNGAGRVRPAVPAHRVVNRNGMLTGKHHFATPTLMEELLAQEGITVKNDKIEDFKTLYWEPGMPKLKSK
jgi:methylated-DNA-protein-cysteine methyltransferase-like protein